jgi:hypothetical protein
MTMNEDIGTIELLATELTAAIAPLEQALDSPETLQGFIEELGWLIPDDIASIGIDPAMVESALSAFEGLLELEDDPQADPAALAASYAQLLVQLAALISHIQSIGARIESHLDSALLASSDIAAELPRRLLDRLIVDHCSERASALYHGLIACGLFEVVEVPADESRFVSEHSRRVIHYRRLPWLLSDPQRLLRAAYGWGTSAANLELLLERLFDLAMASGLPAALLYPIHEKEVALTRITPEDDTEADYPELTIPFYRDDDIDPRVEAGLTLMPLPPRAPGELAGLALCPYASNQLDVELPLDSDELWRLSVTGNLDIVLGIGLLLRPNQDLTVLTDLLGTPSSAAGSLRAEIRRQAQPNESTVLFGQANGSRIAAKDFQAVLQVQATSDTRELSLEIGAKQAELSISFSSGDGFLQTLLPETLSIPKELAIGWSSRRGIYLRGAAGLELNIPIGTALSTRLGDASLHIRLNGDDSGIDGIAGISASAQLGPVKAIVQNTGFRAALRLPADGGNLGIIDLEAGFKAPDGVGLAISAPTVTGGGFLRFDPAKQEYSGVLQLEIAETVAVKAVGLLTTRMPDGSRGYSLVILITAEDFAPIQLGFGFTLTGIGGLLGVHRSTAVDTLRSSLKNGTLGSFLFPADPIRNAPQIVSDLRAVFPAVRDRHVFGPMAQIEWGSPTILTIQLALILELPEPVRLIVLGRLMADLPDAGHSLVRLRMDAVGVIDFNRDEIALDATLYDSRILEFALSGDMALRANWGSRPDFVLAVGGFNPRYPVPAGFPRLRRLILSLGDGDNPRLRFESYLALTSNTVQFGGCLDFAYSAAGFTLAGFLGADALFQFEPFAFVTDVGALVALKRGGSTLMSIGLEATLAGPTPWHIWGKARFKILFFTVKIGFDHRFGHDQPPPLPEPVDALALLVQTLNDRRNWNSVLPRGEPAVVTLREAAAGRLHPLAELSVRQRVVPLNRTVTRFGNAPLASGPAAFEVRASDGLSVVYLQESFAPAQYQDYSDDDKLAQPAFERYDAGLDFGNEDLAYPDEALADSGIVYETEIIDPTRPPDQPRPPVYPLPTASLLHMVDYGAAAQAPIRRGGANRYRSLEPAA